MMTLQEAINIVNDLHRNPAALFDKEREALGDVLDAARNWDLQQRSTLGGADE